MIITYSRKFPGSFLEVSSEVRGRVCQCYLSIRLGGDSMIRRITMVTDIILRIIYLLSQYSNVLIRRITMITDRILRIIYSWSQCLTFQHPRKLPEAMRKRM